QSSNPLDQQRSVHAVGDLRQDDLVAAALELFQADFAANLQTAAPASEIIFDSLQPADHAAGGKIRTLHERHQVLHCDVGVVNLRDDAVNDFAEIMRRHIGGHADGNASAAVDQQVGKGGGKNRRLGEPLVVVGD